MPSEPRDRLNTYLSKRLHRQVKLLAIRTGRTMQALIEEALREQLQRERNGRKSWG